MGSVPEAEAEVMLETQAMLTKYRVWPDGTVQEVDENEPYSWLSDDYLIVWAVSPEAAAAEA